MYDSVIICRGLETKVVDMEVVEEFDSMLYKPTVFKVMLRKLRKKIRTSKVP